jgi:AcrR family transcriptional regulator
MPPRARRRRRTQAERSSATRERLLAATIACLHDRGYARTSTTEIVRRARLSRGAQLHHFPTKEKLVTTAVEWLMEKRLAEFRAALAGGPEGGDRVQRMLDQMWSAMSGKAFYSWLELAVAARTDRALRRVVADIDRRLGAHVRATFRALFGIPADAPRSPLDYAPTFAILFMQGVAVDHMILRDERRTRAMLRALSKISHGPLGVG